MVRPVTVRASLKIADLDGDGNEEVILRNNHLYAVLSPWQGGRLTYLFAHTRSGGTLVVGNPTDDWNFQEELNRYMNRPANHPGALADVGFEHDRYRLSFAETEEHTLVRMTNAQEGSRLFGATKTLLLPPDTPAIIVCYRLPKTTRGFSTETCLSPDYYRLLRRGRSTLSPTAGERLRGYRNGDVAVWVCLAAEEDVSWEEPSKPEVGHGLVVRAAARTPHFHLLLGCGETDDQGRRQLMRQGKELLHSGYANPEDREQARSVEV